jgi:hypothetical protein
MAMRIAVRGSGTTVPVVASACTLATVAQHMHNFVTHTYNILLYMLGCVCALADCHRA